MSRVLRFLPALVLAAAALLVGVRVLAPAEVLAPASAPIEPAPAHAPGVTGRTNVAPLIVDGRIRVYAAKRQVRADSAIDAKTVYTARWSFRRWPEQLSGVVAIGPTVISRWSDGDLVAIDGRTGKIVWRADGPSAPGYAGHRTGAATVWAPPELHVTDDAVIVAAGGSLIAYDAATGARRWTTSLPETCPTGFTTAGGQYVCEDGGGFDLRTGEGIGAWPAGPYVGVGCAVAASRCVGVRHGDTLAWFTDGPAPRRVRALEEPGATVAGRYVIAPVGGDIRVSTADGKVLRTYPSARVLGASAGKLLLLTRERHLITTDPRTGVSTDFPLAVGSEKLTWEPGSWQVVDGHVAIERLWPDGPADPDKPGYYFTVDTVIIAAV